MTVIFNVISITKSVFLQAEILDTRVGVNILIHKEPKHVLTKAFFPITTVSSVTHTKNITIQMCWLCISEENKIHVLTPLPNIQSNETGRIL